MKFAKYLCSCSESENRKMRQFTPANLNLRTVFCRLVVVFVCESRISTLTNWQFTKMSGLQRYGGGVQ